MLSSGNNLSALFRTLAPEESDFTAVGKSADAGVGQEWPLFKVVAPVKPEPTPPLTPQERKRWGMQETVRAEAPKPPLSMSGLSSKLAQSLSQISERMVSEPAQPTSVAAPASSPVDKRPAHASEPATAPKVRASLFSKLSTTADTQVTEEKGKVVGLFEKPAGKPGSTAEHGGRNADDSLSGLFRRLEAKEQTVAKPAEKRSSLSARLGKR